MSENGLKNRRWFFRVRDNVLLKPQSVGKKIEDLKQSDFQEWAIPFIWEKTGDGCEIIEGDGTKVDSKKVSKCLMVAIYKT